MDWVKMEFETVIGLFGVLLLFGAFLLVHRKHTKWLSLEYNALSLAGSVILTWYAWFINDIVFLTINAVWVLTAAYFLAKNKNVDVV